MEILKKCFWGTESDLAYTKVLGVVFQYILWSGSLWDPPNNNMLKNKRIFSTVISKLTSAFSLWLYNLVNPTIISTNTPSKNNWRSLRGVNISSSLLNFGWNICPLYSINIAIFPLHIWKRWLWIAEIILLWFSLSF